MTPPATFWPFILWAYLWLALVIGGMVLLSYGIRTLSARVLTPRWPAWRDHTGEALGTLVGLAFAWSLVGDMDAVLERCACADGLFIIPALVGSFAMGGIAYYLMRVFAVSWLSGMTARQDGGRR